SNRTELKLLQTRERLLGLQLQSYKSEYYPTLSIMGNYSYQGLGNEFLFSAPSDKVNWFDVATIGLSLRVPLFNGFATNARVQQSNVALKKLQEDMSLTEQSMSLGYENAVTQINNNLLVLNSQKQNMELAEEVYKTTIENYNNGLASLTDLLSAENGLTEAQNNYLTTLLNYRLSEIQLLKAQGELNKLLE
ncbi:MAG: TolC family protein, partial [Daejeonella sp.]